MTDNRIPDEELGVPGRTRIANACWVNSVNTQFSIETAATELILTSANRLLIPWCWIMSRNDFVGCRGSDDNAVGSSDENRSNGITTVERD